MLEESDVRKMVRLLAETVAVDVGHAAKKRYLMNGLCRLVDADSCVWALGCHINPGEPQVYVSFLHEGFEEERFTKLISAAEHPVMGKVVEPFFQELADTGQHLTWTREQIDPKGLAMRDGIRELWEDADIGSLVMSYYPLDQDSTSSVVFYRRLSQAAFSERDRRIIHIILGEVSWLHLTGWPNDRGASVPELSPRQRVVLNLLLEGMGRKQIAHQLEITENTVSGYIKEIYRHFSVNSHAQLVRRMLAADLKSEGAPPK
ncbi:hypothetical protein Rhal01_00380 [Rubritalea halochordaticola]|uniref:HTH luxR-type domain-containing protein n=1 Tax=Rubritalea halochordaticola TaxID=714537 RepID=A0ABP9UYV2_9BACT